MSATDTQPPRAVTASTLLSLVRHDIVSACEGRGARSARLLAARAAIDDREAWTAVARDLHARSGVTLAADALAHGDVDTAAAVCARVCGMSREEWEAETLREITDPAEWPAALRVQGFPGVTP